MGGIKNSYVYNQEDMFAKNSIAVSQLLLNSQAGKGAEEWKKMIFQELTQEDIKARDDQKKEIFKGGNASINTAHQSAAN